MRRYLTAAGILSLLMSLGTCAVAKGAHHEIEALIWLLIAVVAGAASAILGELERHRPPPPPKP